MRKWFLLVAVAVAGVGCNQDSGVRERQDAALKDPWNYSPYEKSEPNDISGGGLMEFKGDAFKRDVNSVFSP